MTGSVHVGLRFLAPLRARFRMKPLSRIPWTGWLITSNGMSTAIASSRSAVLEREDDEDRRQRPQDGASLAREAERALNVVRCRSLAPVTHPPILDSHVAVGAWPRELEA